MDELEQFFLNFVEENSKEIANILKKTLVKELCQFCYTEIVCESLKGEELTVEKLMKKLWKS